MNVIVCNLTTIYFIQVAHWGSAFTQEALCRAKKPNSADRCEYQSDHYSRFFV